MPTNVTREQVREDKSRDAFHGFQRGRTMEKNELMLEIEKTINDGNLQEVRQILDDLKPQDATDFRTIITALNNLAEFYTSQNGFEWTELLLLRVHAISEQTLGSDHPDTDQSLNNLTRLYMMQA